MSFRNNLKKSALKLRLTSLERQGGQGRPRPFMDRFNAMRSAREEGQVQEGYEEVQRAPSVAAQVRAQNGPRAFMERSSIPGPIQSYSSAL